MWMKVFSDNADNWEAMSWWFFAYNGWYAIKPNQTK